MKTALLHNKSEAVIDRLKNVIGKEGFTVVSINYEQGIVYGVNKKLFRKPVDLVIRVIQVEPMITRLEIVINSNEAVFSKASTPEQKMEDRLHNDIYKYF